MKIYRLLLLMLLGIPSFAQTHVFPATDTNNSFTGSNTFLGLTDLANLNGRIYVDGVKYALTGAGVQAAINDAITNQTFEVWLPCQTINVSATITILNGPFAMYGCSGGDFNNGFTNRVTAFNWTGGAGSDILQIGPGASGRPASIRLQNFMLEGNNNARYDLRIQGIDVAYILNLKMRGAVTAQFYSVDSTSTTMENTQFTCMLNSAGLVLDWGSNNFNGYATDFDTSSCTTGTAGPMLWIGGGSNQNINFFSGQFNMTAASPVGIIKMTGYDTITSSPWAGAPSVSLGGANQNPVGAPISTEFWGIGYGYSSGPAAPSQGADIVLNGTATNQVLHVGFHGGYLNGASGHATTGVAIDQASFVTLDNIRTDGHISGNASTISTTANSSVVRLINVDRVASGGTDTNLCNPCTTKPILIIDQSTGIGNLDGSVGTPTWNFITDPTTGFSKAGTNYWRFGSAGADQLVLGPTGVVVHSGKSYGYSNGDSWSGTEDIQTSRFAAGVLSIDGSTVGNSAGLLKSGNTVRVASTFTTANNTSLQTITGLSWTLPASGTLTFSFACDLTYSQATGLAAVAFGVQAATNAPTNLFANATQQITGGPPATFVTGTAATTTTTALSVSSGTPGATGTNYTVHLAGTLENPAATANALNIMVSTAAGADAVSIVRGGMCYLTP